MGIAGDIGLDMSGGTAINQGQITGGSSEFGAAAGSGVSLSGGLLVNAGFIAGGASHYQSAIGVQMSGGTLDNSGLLLGSDARPGLELAATATVDNTGTIMGVVFYGSSPAGTAFLDNSGLIYGIFGADGTLNTEMVNAGTILDGLHFGTGNSGLTLVPDSVTEGRISAVPDVTIVTYGTGTISFPTITTIVNMTAIVLASANTEGSIDLAGSFSGFNTIDFGPSATWVLGGTAGELAAGQTITGFDHGDTLVVDGFSASAHELTDGELTLTNATQSLTIDLSGSFTGLIVTDVAQGTEIAVCYLRGTEILTPYGERAIEELLIGDAVITRFGGVERIKWIGRQSFSAAFLKGNDEMLPVQIRAGALGPGLPSRDLFVSPGHSMLLDGQLVLAKFLVNGITVTQQDTQAQVDYFNIELDTHDCVMASGAWAETYAACAVTLGKFHNSTDFFARFPGHVAPLEPNLCAARPRAGSALAAAIAPVVARASVLTRPGPLRGYVDILTSEGRIEGWAQDIANPELPVWLDVVRDDATIGRVLACEMRPDLRKAALGSGRHAFKIIIGDATGAVEIRRSGDGTRLDLTQAAVASRVA
jgi:hypothetical protein